MSRLAAQLYTNQACKVHVHTSKQENLFSDLSFSVSSFNKTIGNISFFSLLKIVKNVLKNYVLNAIHCLHIIWEIDFITFYYHLRIIKTSKYKLSLWTSPRWPLPNYLSVLNVCYMCLYILIWSYVRNVLCLPHV